MFFFGIKKKHHWVCALVLIIFPGPKKIPSPSLHHVYNVAILDPGVPDNIFRITNT